MLKNPGLKEKSGTFRVARQSRIFQDVVDQIQEAILSGEFQTGDMLPSEREMREIFHVSRGTLREALRVLEQKGLIEIRLGVNGGAMVKAGGDAKRDKSGEAMYRANIILTGFMGTGKTTGENFWRNSWDMSFWIRMT